MQIIRAVVTVSYTHLKYYEIIFQDYAESTMFLDAIVSYSENSELKEVAGELKKASDSLLEMCIRDRLRSIRNYVQKFLKKNIVPEGEKQKFLNGRT